MSLLVCEVGSFLFVWIVELIHSLYIIELRMRGLVYVSVRGTSWYALSHNLASLGGSFSIS